MLRFIHNRFRSPVLSLSEVDQSATTSPARNTIFELISESPAFNGIVHGAVYGNASYHSVESELLHCDLSLHLPLSFQ